MGADSWLLGSRCDRVVTCASEVAKEGTVKDGSGYSGGCFGYWEGSRARRGTGVGLWGKRMGCEYGARAREVLPSLGTLNFGA